ncbi:MAG: thiamine-phosphate kinase [Acidobacteria bacterium]|nr:thiamine-phosphate kinase [Acidobacteriota bacterium]
MSETIASLGEQALIERLRAYAGLPPAHVLTGIGDDAAVLRPARNAVSVVTTDALVEGVHFRRDWTGARAIGHKALAVNLSDLAAMGAVPQASLLSLVLPASLPLDDFDGLVAGFVDLARASGAALVGGNLATSPGPIVVDVTAIGAAHPRRVLHRHGAKAGHELYVTGSIGGAAAGLALRQAGLADADLDADACDAVRRFERPEPRVRCGWIVARSGAAAAAMDLSDGLAAAAHSLAAASRLGVTIDAASLPIHPGARTWAERRGLDPAAFALTGGEDYELAFAVHPRMRRRFLAAAARTKGLAVTSVGRFHEEAGVWLRRDGRIQALGEGYGHFRKND